MPAVTASWLKLTSPPRTRGGAVSRPRRAGPSWPWPRRKSSVREVFGPAVRHVLVVGVALAVFQQVTGINTVIYYAPTLLASAGLGNSAALLANVVIGVVNVGMTIVAIRLLDRVGRRPLLLSGTTGMAVGMLVVAVTFLVGGSHLHGGTAVTAIAGLLIYTGSFAIGLGPVFWLLISEIYPVKIRGQAMSVATMANWGANFAVTISFLTVLGILGDAGTFFLFAGITIIALAYFWRQGADGDMPEKFMETFLDGKSFDVSRSLLKPEYREQFYGPKANPPLQIAEKAIALLTSGNNPSGSAG